MAEPSFEIPTTETAEKRLESWKEIAAYLSRDVSTVQRWEKKEGMPVHRHLHDKRGSVYALPEELDAWRSRRQPSGEPEIQPRTETPVARITEPPTRAPKGWLWTAIGVVALLVLIGAYFVFHHRRANQSPPGIRSLAVLPLRNLSGDPSQDYLADGITEALIGRVASIRDLLVISHTSLMRFKNPQISVPEIAKKLGVDAIVEGSVMREGSHIRVTAQLIRGATDEHFWSETTASCAMRSRWRARLHR
jgi:TolB-like protein